MYKEFAVAVSSGDRRVDPPEHSAPEFGQARSDLGADSIVDRRIDDHSLDLADLLAARLELRLDEQDEIGAGQRGAHERSDHTSERDERQVGDHHLDRSADVGRIEIADVVLLEHQHPIVIAYSRMQLAMANIDGGDRCRSALQQTIGESAGRCTRVEDPLTDDVDRERDQRSVELFAAA